MALARLFWEYCALWAQSQLRKVLRNRETPNTSLERWLLRSSREPNTQGAAQVELREIIPRRQQRSFRMLWVNSEARRGNLSRAVVTEALCPRCFCQARSCGSPASSPVASPASWRTGTAGHRGRRPPSPPSCCPRCTTSPSAAPAPRRACGTPGSPHRDPTRLSPPRGTRRTACPRGRRGWAGCHSGGGCPPAAPRAPPLPSDPERGGGCAAPAVIPRLPPRPGSSPFLPRPCSAADRTHRSLRAAAAAVPGYRNRAEPLGRERAPSSAGPLLPGLAAPPTAEGPSLRHTAPRPLFGAPGTGTSQLRVRWPRRPGLARGGAVSAAGGPAGTP